MSFLFRLHRGSLADSMETVRPFEDRADLADYLRSEELGELESIDAYPFAGSVDHRIGWQTHIVMTKIGERVSPAGFTNGPVA